MLTKIREMMQNDGEGGFTLIELLVVVIIIGILAAIAIPVFLNQRNGARDASVKSDINALAKNIESAYTDNNIYPDADALDLFDPRTSPGNELRIAFYDNAGDGPADGANPITAATIAADGGATGAVSYTICGFNADSGKSYIYDSANGGLLESVAEADQDNCDSDYNDGGSGAWGGKSWVTADSVIVVADNNAT